MAVGTIRPDAEPVAGGRAWRRLHRGHLSGRGGGRGMSLLTARCRSIAPAVMIMRELEKLMASVSRTT
jgi:hypothetical protein